MEVYYSILMEPIYFKVYYIGLILAVLPMFFKGMILTWLSLPGMVLFSLGIFWSKWFFYVILRLGLKKKGYQGKVKMLSNGKMLKTIIKGKQNMDMFQY
jgi:hypothetical protein